MSSYSTVTNCTAYPTYLGKADDPGTVGQRLASQFRVAIRRANEIGGFERALRLHVLHGGGHDLFRQLLGGQPPSDNTGAAGQHAVAAVGQVQGLGDGVAHQQRLGDSPVGRTRAYVGHFVVDDQCLERLRFREELSADLDGCARKL